jgi:hypothetical protein
MADLSLKTKRPWQYEQINNLSGKEAIFCDDTSLPDKDSFHFLAESLKKYVSAVILAN